jgi:ABC-type multidrug transport system ATPase subunit
VTALIEISAGFHGDLTGRENVYMNASILGMRKAEIDRKLDAIVAFSGIEEFIDTPVKRYSSGMQARLGFSVAAHVDPDVLLVDEVLSVGDVLFRQRCVQRMRELVKSGTALLFVTHNLEQMQSFCSRTVVLHHGRVVFDGDTGSAVGHYLSALRSKGPTASDDQADTGERITHLLVRNGDEQEVAVARSSEPVEVEVGFELSRRYARLAVEVDVRRELGSCLANFSSIRDEVTFNAPAGCGAVTLSLPQLPLGGGQYLWKALLRDAESTKVVADTGYCHSTFIEDGGKPTGILCLPHNWRQVDQRKAHDDAQCVGAAG